MLGVAELPQKQLSKSLNFHKLRLFYVHKVSNFMDKYFVKINDYIKHIRKI